LICSGRPIGVMRSEAHGARRKFRDLCLERSSPR
jgi:hypothetical protein